jgi:hypothetical protein
MANSKFINTDAQHVELFELWLTISLDADYRARDVFPELRAEYAVRRSGTQLLFVVPIETAQAVLKDSKERMGQLKSLRGVYQSYRALAARLTDQFDESDGVSPDPGFEAISKQLQEISCHAVGTTLYDGNGDRVYLKGGYQLRRVRSSSGPFRTQDGMRCTYRPGYCGIVERSDGTQDEHFFAASDLLDRDGYITHLRLVHSG